MCSDISKLRVKFFTNQEQTGASNAVLVTNVPGMTKGTMLQRLHEARLLITASWLINTIKAV